eukprot:TRINITY_DN32038_c0_g1_i1.p1 TRINITY_DN32038_c0_g1~~TRINITY_DN32038_c0_g1_i1.p1  ORF type:complete len:905 (-),score=112.94 TRINITY_DN32038_c0_g1_i1:295-2979(-)
MASATARRNVLHVRGETEHLRASANVSMIWSLLKVAREHGLKSSLSTRTSIGRHGQGGIRVVHSESSNLQRRDRSTAARNPVPRSQTSGLKLRWKVAMAFSICATRSVCGMERFISAEVSDSAQTITILEGLLKSRDDDGSFAEPTTFVPVCKWYNKIPCACGHVRFDDDDDHHFLPGFERYWHLPTVRKSLSAQKMYRLDGTSLIYLGLSYWPMLGFGNFKNSMDTSFWIHNMYSGIFHPWCSLNKMCVLTIFVNTLKNWAVTLKKMSSDLGAAQKNDFGSLIDHMTKDLVHDEWERAPWWIFHKKAQWVETFVFLTEQISDMLSGTQEEVPLASTDILGEFSQTLVRMGAHFGEDGISGAQLCFGPKQWPRELLEPALFSKERAVHMFAQAVTTAFDKRCSLHVIKRVVLVGMAAKSVFLRGDGVSWPAMTESAKPMPGQSICRLCGSNRLTNGFIHRRVGTADLIFLAADMVVVGGEFQLDILWMAVSADDMCVMVGANFHNLGDSYYSFAHMLPRAHVEHWNCGVTPLFGTAGDEDKVVRDASTVSFSGFASITTCRLSPSVAATVRDVGIKDDAASGPPLVMEVSLSSPEPMGWAPEPFKVCLRSRPQRMRKLSSCTGTLHNADYVHKVMPYAIEDWINYHKLVGIEHFTISDTDGSYEPYLRHFIEEGTVTYHARFPSQIAKKYGQLAAGMRNKRDQRPMLLEAQSLDLCVWENRHLSEWVVAIHSFEEFLHSVKVVEKLGHFSLAALLDDWIRKDMEESSRTAVFEFFQEPMGGRRSSSAATALSAWTHKRDLKIGNEEREKMHQHFQPFSWIVDPLNVEQTAVHFALARAHMQTTVVLPRELLRLNHYVDFGSNKSRCLEELGGCDVVDETILWAEEMVVRMRRRE